ncbi:hypothetical protein GRF29_154g270334 [Pseudopithomyces chartarum]|uniref:Uncharacterized protein n=1 Tax=Pseudopithomyces chartarum TaxID=1892770 RepID=A0AAN6LT60_9PLEO|nr:hypothetical protein GRF29_154g270334 [Pseudopithomyces chartarum]
MAQTRPKKGGPKKIPTTTSTGVSKKPPKKPTQKPTEKPSKKPTKKPSKKPSKKPHPHHPPPPPPPPPPPSHLPLSPHPLSPPLPPPPTPTPTPSHTPYHLLPEGSSLTLSLPPQAAIRHLGTLNCNTCVGLFVPLTPSRAYLAHFNLEPLRANGQPYKNQVLKNYEPRSGRGGGVP